MKFEDGSMAEKEHGAFEPLGGPQEIFEIPTTTVTRAVKSHTLVPNDPMLKYNEMDVKDFSRTFAEPLRITQRSDYVP